MISFTTRHRCRASAPCFEFVSGFVGACVVCRDRSRQLVGRSWEVVVVVVGGGVVVVVVVNTYVTS